MTNKEPEALQLATSLRQESESTSKGVRYSTAKYAAKELERQHAESEQHLQELAAYRFTVENLRTRVAELEAKLVAAPQAVQAAVPATNHSETPNSSTIIVPYGWKLVPDDATPEWVTNLEALPDWREAVGECIKRFLAAAPAHPVDGVPAQAIRDAVIQHLTSAGVLEHDGCGIFIASGNASELIDACVTLAATQAAKQTP